MTARRCFSGKIASGLVSQRAGARMLDLLDQFEAEHTARLGPALGQRKAALDAAEIAAAEAARHAAEIHDAVITQQNLLRQVAAYESEIKALRATPGDLGFGSKAPPTLRNEWNSPLLPAVRSLLFRDIWEVARWQNVDKLADVLRGEAHRLFADGIEYLRPKALGIKQEAARELDVLRAIYGRSDVAIEARGVAEAWNKVAGKQADDFIAAGGNLHKRDNWRLPNPDLEAPKVAAFGREGAKQFWRERADRTQMLDFATGKPLTDGRFEQLLDEAYTGFEQAHNEGLPSAAVKGRTMLANSRDFARFFVWKDADAWMQVAEAMGSHASPFDAMMGHMRAMSHDTAMLSVLGRNPEATKRFILDLFDREAARLQVSAKTGEAVDVRDAARLNKKVAAEVNADRKRFEDLWAEMTGLNRVPVNQDFAATMGNVRSWLAASQLGQALISSFGDVGTLTMTARINGLSTMNVVNRAIQGLGEKGFEIRAAQLGIVADTLAHQAGRADRMLGEEIRTGAIGKMAAAVIRASGLRAWSARLRAAFSMEFMAHLANAQATNFAELEPRLKESLTRYGITADDWKILQRATSHEPSPGAPFLRPADIAALGGSEAQIVARKVGQMVYSEMDFAVIDNDPMVRSMLLGDTRPGTIKGETFRAFAMYRAFPASVITLHGARAVARGWDGTRLGHAAATFITMSLFGVLSMQVKEINAGRDPLSLNPTEAKGVQAWGKAVLQGGGLGVFGDLLFADKTRYGNSWASALAGPQFALVEDVAGQFVLRNLQRAAKGEDTHFIGDAVYLGGRYLPGANLAPVKLAFQRGVLDQAAQWADPRARERFARIERKAQEDFGQRYWMPPGRSEPRRAPDLEAMFGR